jgi:hypothetical protein
MVDAIAKIQRIFAEFCAARDEYDRTINSIDASAFNAESASQQEFGRQKKELIEWQRKADEEHNQNEKTTKRKFTTVKDMAAKRRIESEQRYQDDVQSVDKDCEACNRTHQSSVQATENEITQILQELEKANTERFKQTNRLTRTLDKVASNIETLNNHLTKWNYPTIAKLDDSSPDDPLPTLDELVEEILKQIKLISKAIDATEEAARAERQKQHRLLEEERRRKRLQRLKEQAAAWSRKRLLELFHKDHLKRKNRQRSQLTKMSVRIKQALPLAYTLMLFFIILIMWLMVSIFQTLPSK